jgi:hypothetical protein
MIEDIHAENSTMIRHGIVGGPIFFSNIYAYSSLLHDNPLYFAPIGMHN